MNQLKTNCVKAFVEIRAGNVFHIGYVKEIGIFKLNNTPKQSATYIERSLRFDYL